MPSLGLTSTWGQEAWASYILQHLSTASVLMRAGARVVPVSGRIAHLPRTLSDGAGAWTAEGQEIPSNAPLGDTLTLEPRKIGNVVVLSRESIEDSPVDQLDGVGQALARSIAVSIDNAAFSTAVATATTPGGLLAPGVIGAAVSPVNIDGILRAIGSVAEVGGVANVAFVAPADLTSLRLQKDTAGQPLLQPDLTAGGAEAIGGATLIATPPLAAGTAVVGDASQIVIGIRRDIAVDLSADAKFTADSTVARCTCRVDWQPNDKRGLIAMRSA